MKNLEVDNIAHLLGRLCRWNGVSGSPFALQTGDLRAVDEWPYIMADLELFARKEPVYMIASRRRRMIDHLRDALAVEFGRRRGWQLAKTPFTLPVLARRGTKRNRQGDHGFGHPALDHAYSYREPEPPYCAAAIVGHPYAPCPFFGDLLDQVNGYEMAPEDFPSWHVPKGPGAFTVAVLFTPKYGTPPGAVR